MLPHFPFLRQRRGHTVEATLPQDLVADQIQLFGGQLGALIFVVHTFVKCCVHLTSKMQRQMGAISANRLRCIALGYPEGDRVCARAIE